MLNKQSILSLLEKSLSSYYNNILHDMFNSKAPIDSPTFEGKVSQTEQPTEDNNLTTKKYVDEVKKYIPYIDEEEEHTLFNLSKSEFVHLENYNSYYINLDHSLDIDEKNDYCKIIFDDEVIEINFTTDIDESKVYQSAEFINDEYSISINNHEIFNETKSTTEYSLNNCCIYLFLSSTKDFNNISLITSYINRLDVRCLPVKLNENFIQRITVSNGEELYKAITKDGPYYYDSDYTLYLEPSSDAGKEYKTLNIVPSIFDVTIDAYGKNINLYSEGYSIRLLKDGTYNSYFPLYIDFLQNYALTKTNTKEYTPSRDYNPATKKYVDDSLSNSTASDEEVETMLVEIFGGYYGPGK